MTGIFQTLRGVASGVFQFGFSGPLIRAASAALEARVAAGSAFAIMRGEAPAGPDDFATKLYADSLAGLPPPRIRQITAGGVRPGRTRRGEKIQCFGTLRISTDGLPKQLLTEPAYRAQFELGRYVGDRYSFSKDKRQYIHKGQGFFHPSPWIDGHGVPGSGGTRGGAQTLPDPSVNRPSEWPIAGLAVGGGLDLLAADIFAPWCEIREITDLAGGTVKTLNFRMGRNAKGTNKRAPGYFPARPRGVFAFRYAFFSPITNLWIPSAWSEPVFCRPKAWPVIFTADPQTSGTYPRFRAVAPDAPGLTELAFTVGGKVR